MHLILLLACLIHFWTNLNGHSIQSFSTNNNESNEINEQYLVNNRAERLFPLFRGFLFKNEDCVSNTGDKRMGSCYTNLECRRFGGTAAGMCARRQGVCCIVDGNCGSVSNVPHTYMSSPGYPGAYKPLGRKKCTVGIKKVTANICQILINMTEATLTSPTANGVCTGDIFSVEGGGSEVPDLCGKLTGQHVYVDFQEEEEMIDITVLSNSENDERRWAMHVTQIECNSTQRVLPGCLQYYAAKTDTVKSFNYDSQITAEIIEENNEPGTRLIRKLNYGICIKMLPEHCSIRWTKSSPASFKVSGDATLNGPGEGSRALSGEFACNNDFIIIPNGITVNKPDRIDRYCGTDFDAVTFFPMFEVLRFRNDPCFGSNHLNGTCYTKRECKKHEGSPCGSCAKGMGVCCVLVKSCATKSNVNSTYFTNPEYPLAYTGSGRCTITINKCDTNICQLRLDFLDFSLSQPEASGNCKDDFLTVSGSASVVPRICGENTNQHMYVDFHPGNDPIQISVDTNTMSNSARKWNIKVTQIACDSTSKAPNGCLMYYTTSSGKVMSFNYGTAANPTTNPITDIPGTREITSLNYGICVAMLPGYCSIEWSQDINDPYSFTVSGPTDVEVDIIGTPTAALNGDSCDHDFIVIPNPSQNMIAVGTDRFCGNGFITTTSSSKPFVLTIVTDDKEDGPPPDRANRGFCLKYRQIQCQL